MTLVRCDAEVKLTIKSGRRVVGSQITTPPLVDAAMTVWAATHGGVSGSVGWFDDKGLPIRRPKAHISLVNPERDVLDGRPCPCPNHEENA